VRKFKKGDYVQTSELTFEGFNEICKSMIRDGAGTGEYRAMIKTENRPGLHSRSPNVGLSPRDRHKPPEGS
jgi:hypothetical protein